MGAASRTRRWCPRSCPGSRRGARARRNCSPAAGGPGAGSASRRSTLGRVRGCAEVSPGLGQAGIRVPSPAEPPTHGSRRVGGRRGNSRPRWAEPCPVWTTVPLAGSGYQEGASVPAHLLIVATHSCTGTDPPRPLWAPQEGRAGVLPGLTAGQLSRGHAFFVVTTSSPSQCFSHSCVTQWSPGSDQDSPGCRESQPAGKRSSPGPTPAGAGAVSVHQPPAHRLPELPRLCPEAA